MKQLPIPCHFINFSSMDRLANLYQPVLTGSTPAGVISLLAITSQAWTGGHERLLRLQRTGTDTQLYREKQERPMKQLQFEKMQRTAKHARTHHREPDKNIHEWMFKICRNIPKLEFIDCTAPCLCLYTLMKPTIIVMQFFICTITGTVFVKTQILMTLSASLCSKMVTYEQGDKMWSYDTIVGTKWSYWEFIGDGPNQR